MHERTGSGVYFGEDGTYKPLVYTPFEKYPFKNKYYVESGILHIIGSDGSDSPQKQPLIISKDKTTLYFYGDMDNPHVKVDMDKKITEFEAIGNKLTNASQIIGTWGGSDGEIRYIFYKNGILDSYFLGKFNEKKKYKIDNGNLEIYTDTESQGTRYVYVSKDGKIMYINLQMDYAYTKLK